MIHQGTKLLLLPTKNLGFIKDALYTKQLIA